MSPLTTAFSAGAFEKLSSDGDFMVARVKRESDNLPMLLVVPALEPPPGSSVALLQQAWSLREELDPAWAAQPLELGEFGNRPSLLTRDPGGRFLHELIGAPPAVSNFLRTAIGIARSLGGLHARGLVHKDLKPSNVIVEPSTGRAWLTGFGFASRLPRHRHLHGAPEAVAGTLAYMAPEQTGRMNRSIDSRSDLYSFGVTLYEMLVGALPFTASDAMEWIHCHIARMPAAPNSRVREIPGQLSAIVMKLLAKAAEERYQTAAGVEADLANCLTAWEAHERIDPFPLGVWDISSRLMIPETLYGRENDIALLLAAFDRVVKQGVTELVLVSGYSGVGKSSVVNELHKALVPSRGLFASGKFEQYKRDIPYATLAQAFQGLVRHILGRSDSEVLRWREALAEALGSNGELIVNLIPEVEAIIGKQPPVPDLPPQETKTRFQRVLRRFIGVFARAEHPLTVFLDDLQWVDPATLDLLEHLVTEPDVRHLLLIGAYRDNEVSPAHSLIQKLEAIRKTAASVRDIVLSPLRLEDVRRLVSDALHCTEEHALALAQLVFEKTRGNPFFAIQFITGLAEERLIEFDSHSASWTWDVAGIRAKGITDNVVDLMVGKLNRLPPSTLEALKQLACLGNAAPTATLSMVLGLSEAKTYGALWEVVRSGLVVRTDAAYSFLHDRVQEAAYAFIPDGERAAAHLRIGWALASRMPPAEREEKIFEVVNHLNRGADLIRLDAEREELAGLNLIAGKRAKAATAYASALAYFTAGASLLSEEGWDRHYALTFALNLQQAECEYLTGALALAAERLAMLSLKARNQIDRAAVTCLRVDLYTNLDQPERAVEIGLEYLRLAGIEWSMHPADEEVSRELDRISQQLGNREIEEIFDFPPMSDLECLATLDVLTSVHAPANFIDGNLLSLVIARMANLSLEHGHGNGSCVAYVYLGMILESRFGDFRSGFRFGKLGVDLMEQGGLDRFKARVLCNFGNSINSWTRHLRTSSELLRCAFETAREAGDVTFMAYSFTNLISAQIASGDSLSDVQREAESGLALVQRAQFGTAVDLILSQIGLLRALTGQTPELSSFSHADFDELGFERHVEADPGLSMAACWYRIRKLQVHFFAGEYLSAITAALKAQVLLWTSPAFFVVAEYHFYAALAWAAHHDEAPEDERPRCREALEVHRRQIDIWAENCPENFASRAALVSAEIARLEGCAQDAMRFYEEAMQSARRHGFVQNEAMAYELGARFYAACGFESISAAYLRHARSCYFRWGALGKVRQIERLFPSLREELPPLRSPAVGGPFENLDLQAVLKASQALSGEVVLPSLIEKLMRITVEQAGADRALLIHVRNGEPQIEAEAAAGADATVVHVRQLPAPAAEFPESLLRYVIRSRESVILDDALIPGHFSGDDYFHRRRPRSVLCVPMVKQAELAGLLYMENHLAPHVFTPARLAILKLLASQAAISLENARLYADLQKENAERKLAEEETQRQKAHLDELFELAPEAVALSDADACVIRINREFSNLFGYSPEEAVGQTIGHLIVPDDLRADHERNKSLLKAGERVDAETVRKRKDGERLAVSLVAGRVWLPGGELGAYTIYRDITARQTAADALRRSEEFLAEGQRISRTGSWDWNIATGQLVWSDEHFRIFGLNPHEAKPTFQSFLQRVHPDDLLYVERILDEAKASGSDFSCDFRIVLPDGSVKHVQGKGRFVVGGLGGMDRYIGTTLDITERKRSEEELRRSELSLRKAQGELAHVTRVTTMGELAASIAHEVNQPIAGVVINGNACLRWLSSLKENSPNLGEARAALQRIIRDGNRAGEIIARIRALFRKTEATKEPLDLNSTIREVMVLTRIEMDKKRIHLLLNLADHLPCVVGDRVQLQQVVLNLTLNAIEAMSKVEGRPRECRIGTQLQKDGNVLVTVSDTGIGLGAESMERIFDAFHTTKPDGLGMGLSISRSIVENHSGRLSVTANNGPGVSFQFSLTAVAPAPL